jgi:hypothetical protein
MAIDFVPLTQRHIEAFEDAYQKAKIEEVAGVGHVASALARCAIQSGWLKGINESEIPDMPAREVRELAQQINAEYERVMRIDPNS